jgi:Xaa-Pro aminopeptidase
MQRKRLLRKRLSRLNTSASLVTDLTNVRYLTGFTGSSGYAIISQKHALFITDFRYGEQAKQEVKGYLIKIEHSERAGEIKDICDEYGIKSLGFEDHHITYGFHKKLLKKKVKLRPLSNIVESLRIIKSVKELACIREAVHRAESAFKKLQPHIKAGTTEQKLALKLEELLKEEGCRILPFGVIVASGPMSALPHARPTSRNLKRGDLIVFDWGGECEGYFSDMTRTVLLKGKDIHKQKKIYYNVLDAQKRALGAVRAGVRSSAVDAAAREYIKHKGYGDCFGHGTGHGVGLAVHEKPVVSWRSREMIDTNMVFTVEPGIYLPGFGGVRIEDMVVVKVKKAELLTHLPKRLNII